MAKHFDVVEALLAKLVDALGQGIQVRQRKGQSWHGGDNASGAAKRRRRHLSSISGLVTDSVAADFAENVVPDCPPPYSPLMRQRELQSMYWSTPPWPEEYWPREA